MHYNPAYNHHIFHFVLRYNMYKRKNIDESSVVLKFTKEKRGIREQLSFATRALL